MAETETTTTTPTPTVKLKAGREWTVEAMGVRSLKREYVVVLNAPTGADGEGAIPGLPAIGSKHPNMDGLKVTKHTVTEGSGPDKNTLKVVVEYAAETTTSTVEEEVATVDGSVTEWGWDSGTAQKELVTDVNGEAVVNSAGDPFQTAPTFSAYAPTFTKVIKCGTRKAGARLQLQGQRLERDHRRNALRGEDAALLRGGEADMGRDGLQLSVHHQLQVHVEHGVRGELRRARGDRLGRGGRGRGHEGEGRRERRPQDHNAAKLRDERAGVRHLRRASPYLPWHALSWQLYQNRYLLSSAQQDHE